MKKNIGAQLALYPAPVIVVGAIVNDKPTWTLVAHAGTMAHSHLMVSLVHAHYINQEIIESKKLSVNIVDEAWLKEADRMGVISGNKEDKSESGKIDYHTFKPVLFEFPTYEYFVTGEKVGDCAKMNSSLADCAIMTVCQKAKGWKFHAGEIRRKNECEKRRDHQCMRNAVSDDEF